MPPILLQIRSTASRRALKDASQSIAFVLTEFKTGDWTFTSEVDRSAFTVLAAAYGLLPVPLVVPGKYRQRGRRRFRKDTQFPYQHQDQYPPSRDRPSP